MQKRKENSLPDSVYVDTGAWVALADEDDFNHSNAAVIFPSIIKNCRKLLTSNLVIAETYVLLLKGLGHNAAVSFIDKINTSPRVIRIYSTSELEKKAEEILKKYSDQDFSYTDTVSFSIMKKQEIKKAFCFDKHFQTMGFLKIP